MRLSWKPSLPQACHQEWGTLVRLVAVVQTHVGRMDRPRWYASWVRLMVLALTLVAVMYVHGPTQVLGTVPAPASVVRWNLN